MDQPGASISMRHSVQDVLKRRSSVLLLASVRTTLFLTENFILTDHRFQAVGWPTAADN